MRAGETLKLTLADRDEICLYTLVPLSHTGVTVLGRTDLYVGVKAIVAFDGGRLELAEGGRVAFVSDEGISARTPTRELEIHRANGYSYVDLDKNECILQFFK